MTDDDDELEAIVFISPVGELEVEIFPDLLTSNETKEPNEPDVPKELSEPNEDKINDLVKNIRRKLCYVLLTKNYMLLKEGVNSVPINHVKKLNQTKNCYVCKLNFVDTR